MKHKIKILLTFAGLLFGLSWYLITMNQRQKEISTAEKIKPLSHSRSARSANRDDSLERVRKIAQRRLPMIDFKNKEQMVFSEVDPVIDELEVMELLLAVESEWNIDIPEHAISDQIGHRHRRDLKNHLSLVGVAELLDAAVFPANP